MFEYELVSCNILNTAVMKYTERVILPMGKEWESYKEGTDVQTMDYPARDIADSHELWQQALGRTNAFIYEENQRLIRENASAAVEVDNDTFDLRDIEEKFRTDGKGPHLLELDFVPDAAGPIEYTERGGKLSKYWDWTHRLTGYKLRRFANVSGKSFDTGRLSKCLKMLKECDNPLAYARAQLILTLNDSSPLQSKDTNQVDLVLDRKELIGQQVCISLSRIKN